MKKSRDHSINFFLFFRSLYIPAVILLILLPGCDYLFPPLSGDKISSEEAYNYLSNHKKDNDIVILDIRNKNKFDSLSIENSVNLDFSKPDFTEMTEKLDKNKRYIIVDENGKKAAMAFELFLEERFTKVHYLTGGIEEWVSHNYPVVK